MGLVARGLLGAKVISKCFLGPVKLAIDLFELVKLQHIAQHGSELCTLVGSDFAIGIKESPGFGAVYRGNLPGSFTFSNLSNSTLYSSPFTFSTLRM